jgi:monoamine oxidase
MVQCHETGDGALREALDNLHFAGGETAYEWKGYLGGAITTGKRGAEEVVKALKG